jgi:choline dehydrogenase-like flavoprotein
VIVLEEGGEHPAGTLTGRPRDMMARLYRDGGQVATLGRPPIVLPLGRGIGGTTLVNSGTCFRTPDRVLERWRAQFGLAGLTPAALGPVFDRVEQTVGVDDVPPELAGANAALTRRGAERLGWSGGSLHPASAVWGLFEGEVDMVRGVPQSYFVDEFARDGIMLEGIAGPPDYLALAAPLTGEPHRELMLRYRNVGQCGMMVSDRSRGRVRGRPGAPLIRYDLCRRDVATVHAALVRLAELLAAAGATTLYLPLARMPELPGADPAPLRALDVRRGDLKLMAFHPLGTARAHADPDRGVVDGDLRLHGAQNVYVADGSVVPSALGVNPQITIMALATRLAFHLRGEPCPS